MQQGTAIGKCPKNKVFRGYIELELQLREFDRCRLLYEKFLQFNPQNCTTWMKVVAVCLSLCLCVREVPAVQPTELRHLGEGRVGYVSVALSDWTE